MLFVFAIGSVLADEMPILTVNNEVGFLLNSEAPGKVLIAAPTKDFGRPLVAETSVEAGNVLYMSAFETKTADIVRGAAAGGVARTDENTKIWDHLMGAPGGSDLP